MKTIELAKSKYLNLTEKLLFDSTENYSYSSVMTKYHLNSGGKRLRALIPSAVLIGKFCDASVGVTLGAAAEMIHNATLVHDDLQDGDQYRRDQETVWKKYSTAQAINCGDAMFQYGTEILLTLKLPAEKILEILKLATRCTLVVIEGQAQEFLMKDEAEPGLDRYLEVIQGKTSGLFIFPVVSSLIAINSSEKLIEEAERVANKLGVLFQIQDDFLDLYGNKGRGQEVATDILEGKISFLAAHVFSTGSSVEKNTLRKILKKPREQTTSEDVKIALALFESTGAKKAALQHIAETRDYICNNDILKSDPQFHEFLEEVTTLFLEPIRAFL